MSATGVNDRFNKDPDSDLDYLEDWSAFLAASTGDTIASASWIVPTGITSHSTSHTDTTTTIWLAGGTLGQVYEVVTRITTAQGRVEDKTQFFTIRQH